MPATAAQDSYFPALCPLCGRRRRAYARPIEARYGVDQIVLVCPRCNRCGLREALRHWRAGRDYGYRACCVLHFCVDKLRGLPPAARRGTGSPVPCAWHGRRP